MRFIASAVLAVLIATGAASACQPPPPPPAQEARESDEAYAARMETLRLEEAASVLSYQRWLWDAAETVLIARIEQRTHTMLGSWEMPRVVMRPVRWLKGAGAETTFDLAVTSIGPCGGRGPDWDALSGEVGQSFVVFVDRGRPRQRAVNDAIAVDRIVDPRIQAAINAPF